MYFSRIQLLALVLIALVSQAFCQLPVTSGLQLHLDAYSIQGLQDSDPVSIWYDQSVNNNNATGSVPPVYKVSIINGMPAVRFGGGSFLSCGDIEVHDNDQGLTVIAVGANFSTDSSQKYIVAKYNHFEGWRQWFLASNQATVQDIPGSFSSQQQTTFDSSANSQILMLQWTPNYSLQAFRDGSLLADAEVPSPSMSSTVEPLLVGGLAGGQYPLDGDIAEIIIFNRPLNPSEINQLSTYLSSKYNLPVSLLASRAENPEPAPGKADVLRQVELRWTASPEIANQSYNVYFGTSPQELIQIYSGTQMSVELNQTLDYQTQYYWRVDTTNTVTSDLHTGQLWFFTTFERDCPKVYADINNDCLVNLSDFAILAIDWLDCGLSPSELCTDIVGQQYSIKLWKEIDISDYQGAFVDIGDLDNDGKVDYLLHFVGPWSSVDRLIALGHDGNLLWDIGNTSRTWQEPFKGASPCKGMTSIYDIDGDGQTEVLAEFWNAGIVELRLLDGKTGSLLNSVVSPFPVSLRSGGSRGVPMAFVVYPFGQPGQSWYVIKYDASDTVHPAAAAFDGQLNQKWYRAPAVDHAIGHLPTVADLDADGGDDVLFGQLALDGATGNTIFEQFFNRHADMTDVLDIDGVIYSYVAVDGIGPAYAVAIDGSIIWQKTQAEVWHCQGIWAGDFIPVRPDYEVIMMPAGHIGRFLTVDAQTGESIASFQHRGEVNQYPDTPVKVHWLSADIPSLWIPCDRMIVDGMGHYVQHLGTYDMRVVDRLEPGTTASSLAVQAIPVDVCGDQREELLLYVPYKGKSLFIFTQPDSDGAQKAYIHKSSVYNTKNYF